MVFVDLKTNRDLLDFKFEGYKLSLDPLPVLKRPVLGSVQAFRANEDEYSYLQLHMSSHFNHLFQDLWSSCVFYVGENQTIIWNCLMQDGHLASPQKVWQFPYEGGPKANSAVVFPSADWAVASNGNGGLYILHTVSRAAGEPWTLCHQHTIPDCQSSVYVLDAVHMLFPGRQQIDVLLAHFHKASDNGELDANFVSPPFVCIIEWLSFTCGQNYEDWSLRRTRRLTGSSPLLYIALEKSCDAIYLAAEKEFTISFDSEKPVTAEKTSTDDKVTKIPLYTYIQTPEDITVVFRVQEQTTKSDIQVKFNSRDLDVMCRGKSVLRGQLENPIDAMSSTWFIADDRLEVILCKAEIGLMWRELIKGDDRGEELMDPALVEEIHSRLAYLTSADEVDAPYGPTSLTQLEECDACSDILTFFRIDGNSHQETHRVNMGGHQWLFSSQSCAESLPIICLRHDVDGIVWQPKNISSEGELENFKIEHVATFSALGYVQASKTDKKFASCAPDFNCSVISDCNRHVYIYSQPVSLHSALELRNRRTGEAVSHIAKQFVINLENCNDILGLQVCNECIFVLSSDLLYAIKITAK